MVITTEDETMYIFYYKISFVYCIFFSEDLCTSELQICPRCSFGQNCISQPLKIECATAKVFVVFDNYATVIYAVFMSFWGN